MSEADHNPAGERMGNAPMEPDGSVLLDVDARRRVSLGALATERRYLARLEPGGVIVLEPAVVMSSARAQLLAAGEQVAAGLATVHKHLDDADRDRRGVQLAASVDVTKVA